MAKPKTFILSDANENSYGFRLDMAQLKLERFTSNAVMLYNHQELVGRWENIRVEDGVLLAEPKFMEDANETFALKIKKRVDDDFVKGASLGIHILEVTQTGNETPVVIAEVMECSVCDIPSNKNAIVLFDADGTQLKGESLNLAIDGLKPKTKNVKMKLNATSLATLSLSENATEAEIDLAIAKLSASNATLTTQLGAQRKAETKVILDTAIATGQLVGSNELSLADRRDSFEKLADVDFELFKSTLSTLPKKKKLAGTEVEENADLQGDRDQWSFADWRQKDTAGLLSMKKTDPEKYAEIIKK